MMEELEAGEWLSAEGAATALGITRQAVYLLASRKRLPRREGAGWFVAATAVEALRREREQKRAGRAVKPRAARRRGQPEEAGWVTTRTAARILGLCVKTVHNLTDAGKLTRTVWGRRGYFRVEAVEALAREPNRARRTENRARGAAGLRLARREDAPGETVRGAEAARMLGVCRMRVSRLAQRGMLTVYAVTRGAGRGHWFLAAEVAELAAAREGEREAKAERLAERVEPKRALVTRFRSRAVLPVGGRVDVGDLSEWERYFGEWLTTRQAAWMLNVAMGTVAGLRQRGRLAGRRQETLIHGQMWWHYRKADVVALMNDAGYCKRRYLYERHLSAEGKARLAAEARAREDAELDEARRAGLGRRLIESLLAERW